jgi:hypothetical protein
MGMRQVADQCEVFPGTVSERLANANSAVAAPARGGYRRFSFAIGDKYRCSESTEKGQLMLAAQFRPCALHGAFRRRRAKPTKGIEPDANSRITYVSGTGDMK